MDKHPRLCISAGHGKDSRRDGKTDPGALIVGDPATEADVVRKLALNLSADFGILFPTRGGYVMLRDGGRYYRADDEAANHACDLFLELHVNAGGGTGSEALYESTGSRALAAALSAVTASALGIRDRGAKRNTSIAVLNPHPPGMVSVLLELFFADSRADVRQWKMHWPDAELAIVNAVLRHYGWRTVKTLPRDWNTFQRRAYKP